MIRRLQRKGNVSLVKFEASYAQTVEHAKNAIAATKKQYEDQAAIDQARFH